MYSAASCIPVHVMQCIIICVIIMYLFKNYYMLLNTLTHNYIHITIHEGTILVRIAEEMDLMRQVLSLP